MVPADIEVACHRLRYSGPVFHTPPWQAIFRQDAQRIQTWDEARASDAAVAQAWRDFGYSLSELPLTSISDRADVVQTTIDRSM